MMSIRKQVVILVAILLVFQSIPLSLTYANGETNDTVDPQMGETFRSEQLEYFNLNQPMIPSERETEVVQEFSFMEKTFRTITRQPVLLRFTSTLPANEVLVRVPEEGEIVESEFLNGESVQHSHGEYWTVKTNKQQTTFELPVVFETAGQYFLTVDHDADHFYLEVEDDVLALPESFAEAPEETSEQRELDNEESYLKDQQQESQETEMIDDTPSTVQPITVIEKHLSISEDAIAVEDERVLEETLDPSTRSTSNVSNWSQFRSAWNSSRTTVIQFQSSIAFSSSILGDSLNTRSSGVTVNGNSWVLMFLQSNNALRMNGTHHLTLNSMFIDSSAPITLIEHQGSGMLDIIDLDVSHSETIIAAENIRVPRGTIRVLTTRAVSPIRVTRGGTFTITPSGLLGTRGYITANARSSNSRIKPILTDNASSRIIIDTERLSMGSDISAPRSSWDQVNVTLTGINGSQVLSSESEPNDFAERYTQLFNESWYTSLIFNGSGSEYEPPVQMGTVTAQYTNRDGKELVEPESITGNVGTNYITEPKEIDGWTLTEVPSNAVGVFTTAPITVTYVYEEVKTVHPVDPLDPEKEVDPENPPELPEEQGLLSIDFISSFIFGSQTISVHDQTYYAQPQRLLNEDGTVSEHEERPNYVQISDRRPESERNGWQLAVTQKEQFKSKENHVLNGASLSLANQQVLTAQGGISPAIQPVHTLIPGNRQTLLKAQGSEGTGTWIYRFGDGDTAGESVALDVPKGTNPEATNYSTKLTWELSSIPEN